MLIEKLEQLRNELLNMDTALIATMITEDIPLKYPSNQEIKKWYKLSSKSIEDIAEHFFVDKHTANNYIYGGHPKNIIHRIEIVNFLKSSK